MSHTAAGGKSGERTIEREREGGRRKIQNENSDPAADWVWLKEQSLERSIINAFKAIKRQVSNLKSRCLPAMWLLLAFTTALFFGVCVSVGVGGSAGCSKCNPTWSWFRSFFPGRKVYLKVIPSPCYCCEERVEICLKVFSLANHSVTGILPLEARTKVVSNRSRIRSSTPARKFLGR